MSYRIELLFVGDAPESELARAHILADPTVSQAVKDLSRALEAVGFSHEVTARTVRATPRKRKAAGPSLVEQDAAE
jgi:hypothetical protein